MTVSRAPTKTSPVRITLAFAWSQPAISTILSSSSRSGVGSSGSAAQTL